VAPLELVTPALVRSLSVERMEGFPEPEEKEGSPRGVRRAVQARLRHLIQKVRRSLLVAKRQYKRSHEARGSP